MPKPKLAITIFTPDGSTIEFDEVQIEDTLSPDITFTAWSTQHEQRVRLTTNLGYIIASKVTSYAVPDATGRPYEEVAE
jgi:hypothetical protein